MADSFIPTEIILFSYPLDLKPPVSLPAHVPIMPLVVRFWVQECLTPRYYLIDQHSMEPAHAQPRQSNVLFSSATLPFRKQVAHRPDRCVTEHNLGTPMTSFSSPDRCAEPRLEPNPGRPDKVVTGRYARLPFPDPLPPGVPGVPLGDNSSQEKDLSMEKVRLAAAGTLDRQHVNPPDERIFGDPISNAQEE
ncbi:hypothetical protein CCUS01_14829 [Colletotrichum cuscutae]|uniref:Uncharacterized protein n=1 Tax=Colletotrichum cuscutae TaxID=1209917 RepID=A0AAI9VGC5_9PEZI|nr:hypothetical protein CCUS01_14829 [Colletotrichum cuscutae]